jgi:hypothetical protein
MSDGGLLDSAASIEGLRDYLRAPTPLSTIVLLKPRETAKHLRCSERKLERHRLVGAGMFHAILIATAPLPLKL